MIENCGGCGEEVERGLGIPAHKCVTHQVCCPDILGDEDEPWEWRGHEGRTWAPAAAEHYCDELLDADERSMLDGTQASSNVVRVRTRIWCAHTPADPNWGEWIEYRVFGEVQPHYHATKVKES